MGPFAPHKERPKKGQGGDSSGIPGWEGPGDSPEGCAGLQGNGYVRSACADVSHWPCGAAAPAVGGSGG